MHAEVLLHMLRKGALDGIYTQKPEHGPLVTFPAYMVIRGSALIVLNTKYHPRTLRNKI